MRERRGEELWTDKYRKDEGRKNKGLVQKGSGVGRQRHKGTDS